MCTDMRVGALCTDSCWACCAGVVRSAGDGHVGAAAPQHGCASGCGLVSALRRCGSAVPAHASPGALRRVHQQPEELSRGCERLQLRHGRSAGGRASVSSGHPTLQGQGLTLHTASEHMSSRL